MKRFWETFCESFQEIISPDVLGMVAAISVAAVLIVAIFWCMARAFFWFAGSPS
jgi:hypothetical protein